MTETSGGSESRIATIAQRLDEIARQLNADQIEDPQAAALTDEAAKLAGEVLGEAERMMRQAATDEE